MGTGGIYTTYAQETVGQQITRLTKRITELEMETTELRRYKQREEEDLKLLRGSVTDKSLRGQITIGCVI